MKYYVELIDGYGFTLGQLYLLNDNNRIYDDAGDRRYSEDLEDPTGYQVEI